MFVSLLPSLHSCTVHVHHPKENSTSSRKSDVSFCQQGSSHNKVCFKAFLLFFRKCFQLTLVYICNTFVLKLNVLCGRLFHFATNGLSCEKFVYSVRSSTLDIGVADLSDLSLVVQFHLTFLLKFWTSLKVYRTMTQVMRLLSFETVWKEKLALNFMLKFPFSFAISK